MVHSYEVKRAYCGLFSYFKLSIYLIFFLIYYSLLLSTITVSRV